jgi:hypothetical protein
MYQKPSVPRSIGGVLDDSFRLYKASLPSCLLPVLLVSLVTGTLSYMVLASMPLTAQITPTELFSRYRIIFTTFGIWYVLVFVLSLVLYGMLIVNIVAVSRGETPAFLASLAQATRRAPLLFVASLVFGIVIAIGFILLLIPGLYLWNRLTLYMVPLVSEGRGPFESLGTSWRLVGGNWWRTATVLFVMFAILLVLSIVLGAVVGIFSAFGTGGAGLASNPAAIAGRASLASLAVNFIVQIFTTSLILSTIVALYQDLLLRKGGADLAARVGALSPG